MPREPCHNPRCEKRALVGSKWCRACGERLARIRNEVETEFKGGKGKSFSTRCRLPGCDERRKRRAAYCVLHEHLEVE